jgi:3-methyladenine DNA glycosylase AlkD
VSETNTWARQIRTNLRRGGSPEHAKGVQWFFQEEVRSHGWYTADLRRYARKTSREIQATDGLEALLQVADRLFTGEVLEETGFAVLLLEKSVAKFGEREFKLFESWLDRVRSWGDHDALVHYLIGPMIVAEPRRARHALRWAKSRNRWRRRAAAVSLIRCARQRMLFPQIVRASEALLADQDDMVQKGLGWLLREAAKADSRKTVPYLLRIRDRASRLVLRTACETLPPTTRARVLSAARNQKPRVSSADGP